jgi:hypothetical protein
MSATEWTALFVFCTAMSFSPGPNTTLSTALAANHGLRRALRFCLAVPAGWVLLMLGCGLGLGALILGVPALRWGVKLLGVSYMLWLAWKLSGAAQLAQVDALGVGDAAATIRDADYFGAHLFEQARRSAADITEALDHDPCAGNADVRAFAGLAQNIDQSTGCRFVATV